MPKWMRKTNHCHCLKEIFTAVARIGPGTFRAIKWRRYLEATFRYIFGVDGLTKLRGQASSSNGSVRSVKMVPLISGNRPRRLGFGTGFSWRTKFAMGLPLLQITTVSFPDSMISRSADNGVLASCVFTFIMDWVWFTCRIKWSGRSQKG